MTLKNDECIYTIKNLTADEVRSIEYAYEQFIHNAVNGDFVLSNPIMEKFKARIEKKSIETQEDSLLIPKPKYKKGDVVKNNYGKEEKWEIEGRYYSPDEEKWYYTDFTDVIDYSESELVLVERSQDETNKH